MNIEDDVTGYLSKETYQEPLRLTNGTRIETRVNPNIGPMQAPKRTPPALMRLPIFLHMKAMPVAIRPKSTERPRMIMDSVLSEIPWKRSRPLNSSHVTEAKACNDESNVLSAPENRQEINIPQTPGAFSVNC